MTDNNKRNIPGYLFLCFVAILFISSVASCGKNAVTASVGSNIQLQVLNLSPDLLPVNVTLNYIKRNPNPYNYPTASGYFSISTDTPIQIKSSLTSVSTVAWITERTTVKPNVKYTLFVTGFRSDSSITSIFTTDTSAAATEGRGKIRFVNASLRSPDLDLTANGTMAFSKITYKGVTKYLEVPPGNYEFKITATGDPSKIYSTISNYQVQDGKLYTIYGYGIAGRTDSARFGGGVLINK